MEGSIALNKESQSSFKKAVKNIKKSIKKGVVKVADEAAVEAKRKATAAASERGVIYLSHIPHGFVEDGLKSYFAQFGKVTAVKLVRSKKTGNSRGFAFIEFLHPEVAEVAAKTMNNYLMMDRLIKASYIPPSKQKTSMFRRGRNFQPVTPQTCKRAKNRAEHIARKNAETALESDLKANRNTKKSILTLKKKLADLDVEFNFEPVNNPEEDGDSDEEFNSNSENEDGSNEDDISSDEIQILKKAKPLPTPNALFVSVSDDDDDDNVIELTSKKTPARKIAYVEPENKSSLLSSLQDIIGSSDSEIEFNPNAGMKKAKVSSTSKKAAAKKLMKRKKPSSGPDTSFKTRKVRPRK